MSCVEVDEYVDGGNETQKLPIGVEGGEFHLTQTMHSNSFAERSGSSQTMLQAQSTSPTPTLTPPPPLPATEPPNAAVPSVTMQPPTPVNGHVGSLHKCSTVDEEDIEMFLDYQNCIQTDMSVDGVHTNNVAVLATRKDLMRMLNDGELETRCRSYSITRSILC